MRLSKLVGVILGVMLLLAGCQQVGDVISEEELLEALRAMVEADEAFSADGLSDGGLNNDDYEQAWIPLLFNKAARDTLWPGHFRGIGWGREITDRSWDLYFDDLGEDTAY